MSSNKLNIFQQLVRHWDTVHPYNAGQVMRLRGRADVRAWRDAWLESLDVLGLGRTTVRGKHYHHEILNGTADQHGLVVLPEQTCLNAFLSIEMNRPFDPASDCPFRPFLLQESDTFNIGLIYQHWVADSASVRTVLHDWFLRVFDRASARTTPLRCPPGGYLSVFSPDRAKWRFGEGLLSSARWTSRFRRVRRVESKGFGDFRVRFESHTAPPGTIERVSRFARSRQVKVNDVFLTAMAEVIERHVPLSRQFRRQDVALGTIVDLRPFVKDDLSDVFGLFLGFTSVVCRPQHFADFDTLLNGVSAQTDLHRRTRAALASPFRMSFGLAAARFVGRDPKKVTSFYRKRLPLAGGISNVNLNRTWVTRFHPDPILDYLRISPTGPMMPLVLTPSTIGDTLNLGVTRRHSVVNDELAGKVVEDFLARLASL